VQNVVHRPWNVDVFGDITPGDAKIGVFEEVADVGVDSGDQIIEN
jgi:hypothetical protein